MFWRKHEILEETTRVIPKVGECWILNKKTDNPFETNVVDVYIVAVKDGWVQYSFSKENRTPSSLAEKPIDDFLSIYHEADSQESPNVSWKEFDLLEPVIDLIIKNGTDADKKKCYSKLLDLTAKIESELGKK